MRLGPTKPPGKIELVGFAMTIGLCGGVVVGIDSVVDLSTLPTIPPQIEAGLTVVMLGVLVFLMSLLNRMMCGIAR